MPKCSTKIPRNSEQASQSPEDTRFDMETSREEPKPEGSGSPPSVAAPRSQNALAGGPALPLNLAGPHVAHAAPQALVASPGHSHEGPGALGASAQRFKSGIGSFQGLIDDLVTSVDREREELKAAREQLEVDKSQFQQEKERVNQVLNDNEQVGVQVAWESMHGSWWGHVAWELSVMLHATHA